jgi:hypothetical protein
MSRHRNVVKGARREAAARAGAYDGRFGHRVYTDRKKESERNLCRKGVKVYEEDLEFHDDPESEVSGSDAGSRYQSDRLDPEAWSESLAGDIPTGEHN